MPHVVVEQAGSLEEVFNSLQPFVAPEGGTIFKVNETFLGRRRTSMLLEAVVIEESHARAFFVQLSQKDQAITVRLLPATDPPEKTPGVKRLLGLVAARLRAIFPGSRFGKTNLQGFLEEKQP